MKFSDRDLMGSEIRQRMLRDLLRRQGLRAVFQPILDLGQQRYFACEALIRGPQESPLELPAQLFATAARAGCTAELEWQALETAIRQFAELGSPLRLFLNLSVGCLESHRQRLPAMRQQLLQLGIPPSRIVIELTDNQAVPDYSALHAALDDFRRIGIQVAMDDVGEGFSNLRMWSEVHPDFIKIDRHFISRIDEDNVKFHFVRAMQELCEACGGVLIAEGVETDGELRTLHKLGIAYVQGFRVARPGALLNPLSPLPDFDGPALSIPSRPPRRSMPCIDQLLHEVAPIPPATENDAVYQIFERHPELTILPVVDRGLPLGIITRSALIDRFARPYRRELYGKRPCALLMDLPTLVDEKQSVQEVAQLIGNQRGAQISDCFIITRDGRYRGIGYSRELMGLITDLQIRAARYANPLTQLPGNVPINEQIDRLLEAGAGFVAAYCDLDHFKPYNDAYGYRRGDHIIEQLGTLLTAHIDSPEDFIGHVGGDDFIAILQSPDWEERLQGVIDDFTAELHLHVSAEHLLAGGYSGEDRRGQAVFHALPALSIGCVVIQPGDFFSHHEVSAALGEAKKEAKRLPGSALFVERRRPHGAVPPAPTFDDDHEAR